MNTPHDSSLGREVAYPTRYDPSLLFPIPRGRAPRAPALKPPPFPETTMTPLAEMVPAMSDADLKALRVNAERLSDDASAVRAAAAAEIIPIIDAESARRAALAPAPAPKKRAPAKKKAVPATGHQTALPSKAAA